MDYQSPEQVREFVGKEHAVAKRNGNIVDFDIYKIENAIRRCLNSCTEPTNYTAEEVTHAVLVKLADQGQYLFPVEQLQDTVVSTLGELEEVEAQQRYQNYRTEHAALRVLKPIPEHVRAKFDEAAKYFPTQLQQFQFFDKYSRFNYDYGRRETWVETVGRTVNFLKELSGNRLSDTTYELIRQNILEMKVMPSMRLLAMAGDAARRNNISVFNCSFMTVKALYAFVEAVIISMAGCGVGYSVERQYVDQLPAVPNQDPSVPNIKHVVEDSSEGWAEALRVGLEAWFNGKDVDFDLTQVRPAGAVLRTKGGRASGPGPLYKMLANIGLIVLNAQGRKLTPLECHDIMCHIGDAVVSGGVRRTALICLFDFDDQEMLTCKSPENLEGNEQRWNANNSAVWPDRGITRAELEWQFDEMFRGGNGEPGIFNRKAIRDLSPERRKTELIVGTNPCGEIALRDMEFCNLSAAVARPDDTIVSLSKKVYVATVIGTIQSMSTDFKGLRPDWKKNCDEERLLGVDITGQMDCPAVQDPSNLELLKRVAQITNKEVAKQLGINPAAAITCVKPSGNTSQLVNCSSGLHARHYKFYERRVRVNATSPVLKILREAGVPLSPENGQTEENATSWVATFPVKSPDTAIVAADLDVVAQCEVWLRNKLHWTEHNPSVTIMYEPHELDTLVDWVWNHRHLVGGMAFLPKFHNDIGLKQLPYTEITEEEYERLAAEFPREVPWHRLMRYEESDYTEAAQTLACLAGGDC